MNKIAAFFRNVGRIFASPFNKVLGTGLTQAQYEQNEWNAYEAALNRDFQHEEALLQRNWSAAEAERARDWNEEMYEKYNSLSGKIAQAEKAGVNPMFAVTGDSVTPAPTSSPMPSGSAAAGSAASGSLSATDSFVNLIGQLIGAQKLKSEISVNESVAEKNRAEAEGSKINNESLRDMNAAEILAKLSQIDLNDANINLISSKIVNTDADTKVKGAQLGQIASQIANTNADTRVKVHQVGVLLTDIAKNNKSLDVMDAQIAEMLSNVGVNRAEVSKLSQEFRNLVQDHNINELESKLNDMLEPDGSENFFEKFCYKLLAILK